MLNVGRLVHLWVVDHRHGVPGLGEQHLRHGGLRPPAQKRRKLLHVLQRQHGVVAACMVERRPASVALSKGLVLAFFRGLTMHEADVRLGGDDTLLGVKHAAMVFGLPLAVDALVPLEGVEKVGQVGLQGRTLQHIGRPAAEGCGWRTQAGVDGDARGKIHRRKTPTHTHTDTLDRGRGWTGVKDNGADVLVAPLAAHGFENVRHEPERARNAVEQQRLVLALQASAGKDKGSIVVEMSV